MKEITVKFDKIEVVIAVDDSGAGVVVKSNLVDSIDSDPYSESDYLAGAAEALEMLILTHACAGVDVTDPKYIKGLEDALQGIGNSMT